MSTLLYDTLKELQESVRRLTERVNQLEHQSPSAPGTPPPDLPAQILAFIASHWERKLEPIQQRFVSQSFAKRASRHGGLRKLLGDLEKEDKIRLLQIHSGATLIFPAEAFAQLSQKSLDNLIYAGMTEAQIERLKARGRLYFDSVQEQSGGPSAEELARANAEAIKKLTEEGAKK